MKLYTRGCTHERVATIPHLPEAPGVFRSLFFTPGYVQRPARVAWGKEALSPAQ